MATDRSLVAVVRFNFANPRIAESEGKTSEFSGSKLDKRKRRRIEMSPTGDVELPATLRALPVQEVKDSLESPPSSSESSDDLNAGERNDHDLLEAEVDPLLTTSTGGWIAVWFVTLLICLYPIILRSVSVPKSNLNFDPPRLDFHVRIVASCVRS